MAHKPITYRQYVIKLLLKENLNNVLVRHKLLVRTLHTCYCTRFKNQNVNYGRALVRCLQNRLWKTQLLNFECIIGSFVRVHYFRYFLIRELRWIFLKTFAYSCIAKRRTYFIVA